MPGPVLGTGHVNAQAKVMLSAILERETTLSLHSHAWRVLLRQTGSHGSTSEGAEVGLQARKGLLEAVT